MMQNKKYPKQRKINQTNIHFILSVYTHTHNFTFENWVSVRKK